MKQTIYQWANKMQNWHVKNSACINIAIDHLTHNHGARVQILAGNSKNQNGNQQASFSWIDDSTFE